MSKQNIKRGNYKMSDFIPGLKLCEDFFFESVKPILNSEFPELNYSAGLIGGGSEVLGLDTPQSMDHHWGPKTQLFLQTRDYEKYKDKIICVLSKKLPYKFKGISTNFGKPDEIGVQLLEEIESGPVNHLVYVINIDDYSQKNPGFQPKDLIGWINTPEQKLLEVTAGKVFYDCLNELTKIREEYSYYPKDVWFYKMSRLWQKIADEEAFVGRTGDVGDELGSRLIAARIIENLMHLCFLVEKKYAPYSKWFGTAFSKLNIASKLIPIFQSALYSLAWKEREKFLSQAYEIVVQLYNDLKITKPVKNKVSYFYNRPYLVIHADIIAKQIKGQIVNREIRNYKVK